jgi:hypothetical protein
LRHGEGEINDPAEEKFPAIGAIQPKKMIFQFLSTYNYLAADFGVFSGSVQNQPPTGA